jgi:outer membrane protein OmpA-like peptidoglycan-associated protein
MAHSLVHRSAFLVLVLAACGGSSATSSSGASSGSHAAASSSGDDSSSDSSDEFQLSDSDSAGSAHGDHPSQITATATEAAMRLFVVDPDAGPLPGIVIKLTAPDGHAYYTDETDSQGYAEVLVPAGQRYDLEYLALGHRSHTAHVEVPSGPRQDIRLTLRYHPWHPPARPAASPGSTAPAAEGLVLDGILFESGSATLDPESNPRLDRVVEYMTHRPHVRIRITGHTDNVGDPRRNQALSETRAEAVRSYLVAHGVDGGRVEAVGLGDAQPVATNDTEEGRARNRRIEAEEL